jgi:hypothetical protein
MIFLCWNFSLYYWLMEHTASAACLSYVMHLIVTSARSTYGMQNLAKKTTVDARFLI